MLDVAGVHAGFGEDPELISRPGGLATDNEKSRCRSAFIVNRICVAAVAVWWLNRNDTLGFARRDLSVISAGCCCAGLPLPIAIYRTQ